MTLNSTAVLISDMTAHTQGIVEAANRIESFYILAAEKQDNEQFIRTLYLDAQDNLGAVIKLESKLYTYANLLRSVAGISLEDGSTTKQSERCRKANGSNR